MAAPNRLNLVVSSSSVIMHQLRWYSFRRLDLKVRVASTMSALLRLVDQETPNAVVVESQLAEGDGFSVAQAVKGARGLSRTAVIVVTEANVSRNLAAILVKSQTDQLLVQPLVPGQLYEALADFFDLPRRMHARVSMPSSVSTTVAEQEFRSRLMDLSTTGARIRLASTPSRATAVSLRLPARNGTSFSIAAKIVWQRAYESGVEIAVRFQDPSAEEREHLHALLTWEIQDRSPGQLVRILADINERLDLEGLSGLLQGPVEFDLSQVNRINSVGVSTWVRFLESLPSTLQYRFSRCSASFAEQAGYLPALLGKGSIVSVHAPFTCPRCEAEVEREVTAEAVAQGLPEPICSCGRPMVFDGDSRRFFASMAE